MTTNIRRYLPPIWSHWHVMPRATVFQCVALSVDIEPRNVVRKSSLIELKFLRRLHHSGEPPCHPDTVASRAH
jgi:hypothetical protein